MMGNNVLVSGAAGFIGSHLVDFILKNTDWFVVGLDRLDEAGNLNLINELESWRNYP